MRKWLWALAGIGGLILYITASWYQSALPFVPNVTRDQAVALSRAYLENEGEDLAGYAYANQLSADPALTYLLRRSGNEEGQALIRKYPAAFWRIRWFTPGGLSEYVVYVDPFAPKVQGYLRQATPAERAGGRLSLGDARKVAERYLEGHGYQLQGWEFTQHTPVERSQRLDHRFVWQRQPVELGEAIWTLEVLVEGGRPTGLRPSLQVPEEIAAQYRAELARVDLVFPVREAVSYLIGLVSMVLAVRFVREKRINWRLGMIAALPAAVLLFSVELNGIGWERNAQTLALTWAGYLISWFGFALFWAVVNGTGILLATATSEVVLREEGVEVGAHLRDALTGGLATRGFLGAALRGLAGGGAMLGILGLFLALDIGGAPAAAVSRLDFIVSKVPLWLVPPLDRLPSLWGILFQLMLFPAALARRWLRPAFLAFAVPVLTMALGMFAYDHPLTPVWAWLLQSLLLSGALVWLYWRDSLETALVALFAFETATALLPMLRSESPGIVLQAAIALLWPLAPALLSWWAVRRLAASRGANPRTANLEILTPTRTLPPLPERHEPRFDRLCEGLQKRRTWGAAVGLVVLLLAMTVGNGLPPSLTTGYSVPRPEAEQRAAAFLAEHRMDFQGLRVTAVTETDDTVSYLRRTAPENAVGVARDYAPVRWVVRYFAADAREVYRVEVDPHRGHIVGFFRPLDDAAPGARIPPAQARTLAEAARVRATVVSARTKRETVMQVGVFLVFLLGFYYGFRGLIDPWPAVQLAIVGGLLYLVGDVPRLWTNMAGGGGAVEIARVADAVVEAVLTAAGIGGLAMLGAEASRRYVRRKPDWAGGALWGLAAAGCAVGAGSLLRLGWQLVEPAAPLPPVGLSEGYLGLPGTAATGYMAVAAGLLAPGVVWLVARRLRPDHREQRLAESA